MRNCICKFINTVIYAVAVSPLWLLLPCIGCDSSVSPSLAVVSICDSLSIESLDSMVIIKQPMLVSGRVVFTSQSVYMGSSQRNVVFNLLERNVENYLPSSTFDCRGDSIIYSQGETIFLYTISGRKTREIVRGFYWPTFSSDKNCINIRNGSGTYRYDMKSGSVSLAVTKYDAREVDNGTYLYYDDGFWAYSTDTKKAVKLDIIGLPKKSGSMRLLDWDVDRHSAHIVVHLKESYSGDSADGLFEIDLSSMKACKLLGHTDGSYTPRYTEDSRIVFVRPCQPKHESYIAIYNREQKTEEVLLTAKFIDRDYILYLVNG
jgi:hypothetical protein